MGGDDRVAHTEADRAERLVSALRLIRTPHVGAASYHGLVARYGGPAEALEALPQIARRLSTDAQPPSVAEVEREIGRLHKMGGRFLVFGEADYPALLTGIEAPPPVLAIVGQPGPLSRPSVGIVGARNASAAGRRFARQLARDLADEGVTVISGIARGIDTAAHEGSLDGGTVAVLAGGVDYVYPPENEKLHHAIGAAGCRVSEMPVGFVPRARHFPQRNRLIAGLSEVVVVVEAAQRSGALITARLAGEAGREVLAVPGSPLDPRSKGANRLIRNGATLCEGADDVLEALQAVPRVRHPGLAEGELRRAAPSFETHEITAEAETHAAPASFSDGSATDARALLLEILSQTPTDQDEIARQSGLPVAVVASILLELELEGVCQRLGAQQVALA